jgi:DNA-binding protein YbaB
MSTETHPQLAEVLRQAQHMQSAVDRQLHQLNTRSFNGTDEAKTVAVTLDGRQRLTGLHIIDGLLRLGTEVVAQRINEAIYNAQHAAVAAIEAEHPRLAGLIDDANRSLDDTVGPLPAKSG